MSDENNVCVLKVGKRTPQQVLLDAQQHDPERLIVISRVDGQIVVSWSAGSLPYYMGMLDLAKEELISVLRRPRD